jgi:hypothetical protein
MYANSKTIPGVGGRGDRGEHWRGLIQIDIFDTL